MKKIEFLNRLFELIHCKISLLDLLKMEKVITDDEAQRLMNEHHSAHAQKIISIMAQAVKDEKLQLVDYEWTILPKEILKLTIVSRNNKKEFEYGV